ncbi:MAG: hypothetical protein OXE99_14090 [Cellvibrionales bacterium]|nr:hypothetical protein [Cellvibrionales bacterium]
MHKFQRGLAEYWPFLLLFLLFGFLSHYYFAQIGDDGYIYFRYVAQALDGYFGRWSQGIEPVEGYSSPLWFLLLTGVSATGVDVKSAAQWLGLGFALLSLAGTWRLGRLLGLTNHQAALPCFALLLTTGFHYWSTAGLETPMVIAITVWLAIAFVSGHLKGFWLAMISLARPEGIFLLPLLVISDRLVSPSPLKIKAILFASSPFVTWFIFRLCVYELPLPNTFYAKATGNLIEQIFRGIVYVLPILFLWVICWAAYFKKPETKRLMVIGLASWVLSFIVVGGGDWMIHFRLLLPVIPLVLVVSCLVFFESRWVMRSIISLAFIPFLLLWVTPKDLMQTLQAKRLPEIFYQEGEMTRASIDLAQKIREKYMVENLVIAVNHAGALPYALNASTIIDMVGLNNKTIAQAEGLLHKKYDVDYVLSLKPDLIVLNTRSDPGKNNDTFEANYWAGETDLVTTDAFQAHYQYSGLQVSWGWRISPPYQWIYPGFPRSWIVVFERKS